MGFSSKDELIGLVVRRLTFFLDRFTTAWLPVAVTRLPSETRKMFGW
jgi:hypothetical protein